tara:strand:- start:654 stop:1340 length:687 start_codon:yes stop_codon:yes gene_type:complete
MANVNVQAQFMLNTGELISFGGVLTDNGGYQELQTNTTYSTSATSLGQFANGKMLTQIVQAPSCSTGVAGAYIERRGAILCALPVLSQGVQSSPCMMPMNVVLQAGDVLRVKPITASSRVATLSVITGQGTHAIFEVTPSGAGNNDVVHILSGQSVGQSLTGQTIVHHWLTSIDGSKLVTGGVLYLNDRGLPIGGTSATNPQVLQTKANSMGGASINLNFVGRITTNL